MAIAQKTASGIATGFDHDRADSERHTKGGAAKGRSPCASPRPRFRRLRAARVDAADNSVAPCHGVGDLEAMKPLPTFFSRMAVVASLLFAIGSPAWAHPHVFVEARSEIVFNDKVEVVAVRHIWRFDAAFTSFAIQGLDTDGDGKLSQDELAPLAKINMESLKDYEFFTYLDVGAAQAKFSEPEEYWLDFSDGRLTLFYTLPLEKPLAASKQRSELAVFDPEYFIAFEMTETDPFVLVDAAAGCKLETARAEAPDPATAAMLAQIPQDVRELPKEFQAVTETLSNNAVVRCP
ncbi:DUF1007 family protein [Breoghania sp. L-A4]|nr:DUF1007 family protein [Breoghania sp. L-A4]